MAKREKDQARGSAKSKSRRLSQTEKQKAEELLRLSLSPAKVKDYLNSLTVISKTMTSNTSKMEKPLSLIWGCELNDKSKTATFVSDDTKYQHQLALRTICLGAEAKEEFNVVEIVPGEGEGADAKPVPLATLKSSVMPTVTISGIELPSRVTFRLKAGSGPVYISGQHILEEDLSFDEEDGEEEEEDDEDMDEEIEESPPKPVKRAASSKKSAPTKRKKTDEEDDEEEELASEEESPPKKGKGRGRKPAAKK
ncbi:nucleoplasmin-2b isoform X2 [Polyodon spathula]|uniref:nucleoplasmin-2b isoform X2 n=1 Tax=Polyodon spathula TaxID=7913 RepID=UPI001B7DF3B8|nr:nucleoplasmin-2b isoform X2 [Polyodon spathula]